MVHVAATTLKTQILHHLLECLRVLYHSCQQWPVGPLNLSLYVIILIIGSVNCCTRLLFNSTAANKTTPGAPPLLLQPHLLQPQITKLWTEITTTPLSPPTSPKRAAPGPPSQLTLQPRHRHSSRSPTPATPDHEAPPAMLSCLMQASPYPAGTYQCAQG